MGFFPDIATGASYMEEILGVDRLYRIDFSVGDISKTNNI